MGKEEQAEEREVLDSIFPEEITDISDSEYRIAVTLDPPHDGGGGDDDGSSEPPTLILHVRYPENYPDEAPILDLSAPQNQNGGNNNATPPRPHPHFAVAADKAQLLHVLDGTVQENLGMAMIFTVVSALKEAAEQLIADRREAAARVREEALLEAERAENQKFHGTPVTPDTFARWRDGFLREMEEQRRREEEERLAELKKARVKEPARLTGKQLWERGLVGKGDEGDEDDAPAEQVEKLKIGA
ncbi:RWD-domain-containing protein [Xylariaceae sp. FL0662B]|nr:RWD-domain-containing protein [Xylariaceae sp. FL0662B]